MIPVFVNAVMGMLGENFSVSACWKSVKNPSGRSTYISPYETKKQKVIPNPDDYEKGKKRENPTGDSSYTGEVIEGTAQQYKDVVWDSTNVTRISNLTSTQLIAVLNAHGGKAKNFIPYAQGLITAEQKYSVNVFFLIGIEALESGWCTSKISQNCNNLGGVRESKAHPSNGCGSNKGGGFAYFNTVNEFIDYHGNLLHNKYLTPGGPYYNGKTPSAVVIKYCPGCSNWPREVTSIANSLFKHVKEVL
jgi:flagellum-specific peptidoglycan hydrolase FlgJ